LAAGRSSTESPPDVALGVGQFCTKPGFLVVPADPETPTLLDSLRHGHPGGQMLSEGIRDSFQKSLDDVQGRAAIRTLFDAGSGQTEQLKLLAIRAEDVLAAPEILQMEMFGPASVVVEYTDADQIERLADAIDGQLTAAIHAESGDDVQNLAGILAARVGRVLYNGWPTGVSVTYAQQHGGPYPATTAAGTTSVGTAAMRRFVRPVAYQDFPQSHLPDALRDTNPWRLRRRVDGEWVEQ
jgi:NADP-dependent aldehyde dehydrogenase